MRCLSLSKRQPRPRGDAGNATLTTPQQRPSRSGRPFLSWSPTRKNLPASSRRWTHTLTRRVRMCYCFPSQGRGFQTHYVPGHLFSPSRSASTVTLLASSREQRLDGSLNACDAACRPGNAERRPGRTQRPAFSLQGYVCDHRVQPPRGRGSPRPRDHPGRSGGAS